MATPSAEIGSGLADTDIDAGAGTDADAEIEAGLCLGASRR